MTTIECWTAIDGTPLHIREIQPQDIGGLDRLYRGLSSEDRRRRFHGGVNGLTLATLRRMTSIDRRDEEAYVIAALTDQGESIVADARFVIDDSDYAAEFALVVAPDWRRQGLGQRCIRTLEKVAEARGIRRLYGTVVGDNLPALALMLRCGLRCFTNSYDMRLRSVEQHIRSAVVPFRQALYA